MNDWSPAMPEATPVMERFRLALLAAGVDPTDPKVEDAIVEYTMALCRVTRDFVRGLDR